jgi:GDP-mannose 6-dehydrogenase
MDGCGKRPLTIRACIKTSGSMKVSVFGLGYVGTVTSACLSALGHTVVGVDNVPHKVSVINTGVSPVVEKDLDPVIANTVRCGRLRASLDSCQAILDTDISLVCVGTPSKANGDLDTSAVVSVCREIGTALRQKPSCHSIVIRSTVFPGTIRNLVVPVLEEASGLKAGTDFGIGANPEFLREGSALRDFHNPPKTVIGVLDDTTGERLSSLYQQLPGPLIRTTIEIAEMIKYSDNTWHALKVAFANEIGQICKRLDIDSHAVMDIFCQDSTLNISPNYLRPGFSFGGSCLPKDVRAMAYKARSLDLDLPLINAIMPSNQTQTARALDMILAQGKRSITFLGMTFKAGTDDLRESPILELIERVIGKGYAVRIFDQDVNLSKLIGANRQHLLRMIPHISALLVDSLDEALAESEIIVIGNGDPEFQDIAPRIGSNQIVIDLVRIRSRQQLNGQYHGISW